MFDIGAIELLIIVIVAVVVIGPKDMPLAMRTAGRWIGKIRRVSAHFRSGIDAMVREAELEEMQAEWNKRNAEIMAKHPEAVRPAHDGEAPALPQPAATGASDTPPSDAADAQMEPYDPPAPAASPEPVPAPAPSKADQ
ncbi:Sec-independent protein translocase protein TatB [Croceicoccus marinus]|jgi:sec-independent protein translocase protein TatB|uniref:Sec-independent protein translocase protein TatB n=1 Tax=Croceicoccus marinus TaxID=450378 RepID=A0A7G6VWB5_9SPHN|nr:Sec-independent protein translocase protein TatB [Croceicoccus marinus]QNE06030.1 twin-arginine translocase subunit TatB [Croceicoccus marinus]